MMGLFIIRSLDGGMLPLDNRGVFMIRSQVNNIKQVGAINPPLRVPCRAARVL